MSLFGAFVDLHLSNKDEISNYLEELAKNEIRLVIISLNYFKKEQKEEWEKLAILTGVARKYQMEVIGEIGVELLKELNLLTKKPKELIVFFRSKGLSGVKIVDEVDLDLQAKLTHNNQFKVIINGSYNIMQLDQLILGHRINSNNVISCYNFYPQRHTGASVDFYLINQYESHINNILFAGFVGSDSSSLEIHRDWPLATQIHHLIALGTDIILIANQLAKGLINLKDIDQEKVTLVVDLDSEISSQEKTILLDQKIHFVRPDLAQDIIRSSHVTGSDSKIAVRKQKSNYFEIGDVVILNQDAKQDVAQLQIIIKKIKNDGIRNLVAKIKEPYLSFFLSELKATRGFKFII